MTNVKNPNINTANVDAYFDEFPAKLRKLMRATKTTQEKLAKIVGVTRQTISNYADGSKKPKIDVLNKMALHFDVSTDYLLRQTKSKSDNPINVTIANYLGLSDESIQNLRHENMKIPPEISLVDVANIIFNGSKESNNFLELLYDFLDIYEDPYLCYSFGRYYSDGRTLDNETLEFNEEQLLKIKFMPIQEALNKLRLKHTTQVMAELDKGDDEL